MTTGTTNQTKKKTTGTAKASPAKQKENEMATATATEPQFEKTTTPPSFVRGQGRGKSPERLAIEALKPGEFLNVGKASDKRKNSVRSMTSTIQRDARLEGKDITFTVREGEDGNLWVGAK